MNKRRQRLYIYYTYVMRKATQNIIRRIPQRPFAAGSVINEKYPIKFEHSICTRVERLNKKETAGKHTEKHLRYSTTAAILIFPNGSHYSADTKHTLI